MFGNRATDATSRTSYSGELLKCTGRVWGQMLYRESREPHPQILLKRDHLIHPIHIIGLIAHATIITEIIYKQDSVLEKSEGGKCLTNIIRKGMQMNFFYLCNPGLICRFVFHTEAHRRSSSLSDSEEQREASQHEEDARIQLCHLNADLLWVYAKNKTSSLVAIPGTNQDELTQTEASQGVQLLRLTL